MKYQNGDFIVLLWDGRPERLFVKGHMTPREATDIMHGETDYAYELTEPRPEYARWSVGYNSNGELSQLLADGYKERGRGRFPVMAADVIRKLPFDEWRQLMDALNAEKGEADE